MLLNRVISQIQYGELSQIILGDGSGLGLTTAQFPAVFNYINLGLTDLHTRFPLRTETLKLQQSPNITHYYLRKKFAESNTTSTEPVKYILDADKPFNDEILKIDKITDLGVTDPNKVSVYPINDTGSWYNVNMPMMDMLVPPFPDTGSILEIQYRAAHPHINMETYNADTTEIDLPISHIQALICYIAAKAYTPMGIVEAKNESSMYWGRYEAECARLNNLGFTVTSNDTYDRLHDNGWV